MKSAEDLLAMIGHTPLLKLRKVTSALDSNVFVKCEYANPSGSIKDRIALGMIDGAEKRNSLKSGGTIVDATSGNTGISLSFVGGVKGYKVRLIIPSKWASSFRPDDRIKMMKIFGAEVIEVELQRYKELLAGLKGSRYLAASYGLLLKACYDMEREDKSVWWADQMSNPDNPLAHKIGTGREIIEQTDGNVSAFVSSVGNGGTLLGVGQALREDSSTSAAAVVGVGPSDQRFIDDWQEPSFLIDFLAKLGLPRKKYIIQEMSEKAIPDEIVYVGHQTAREMANRLAREEGVLCGISSGANVYAALRVAKGLPKGSNVVTICVDRRDRYMSEYPNESYVV